MGNIIDGLRKHSEGLLFMSESEFPFEIVSFENRKAFDDAIAVEGNLSSETREIDYFFRNMVKVLPEHSPEEIKITEKFGGLLKFIKENLKDPKVYRLGEVQVKAYIVGETPEGKIAGLSTTLIET